MSTLMISALIIDTLHKNDGLRVSKAHITKRTEAVFEELMALTWHPDRVDARRAHGLACDAM